MVIAALIAFGLLVVAWLVAPSTEPAPRQAASPATAEHGALAAVPVEIR